LFDCGDGCLADLFISEVKAADHLFFSHLHMDHIGGFDSFFRCNFNRDVKPNMIWGPPGTSTVLQHRFRGFWWNLHEDQPGTWLVNDIHADQIERSRYEISDAFTIRHADATIDHDGVIVEEKEFAIKIIHLEHNGPCLGYLVRENPRLNVQVDRLEPLGLQPGPWMQELKSSSTSSTIEINGKTFELAGLRDKLLVETPGESVAYLTDFLLDDRYAGNLEVWLRDCDTVVCEAQYRHSDIELARRNFHTTTSLVSRLAARARVGKLVLFHLSDRYSPEEWLEMLKECRENFPATVFPNDWGIEA